MWTRARAAASAQVAATASAQRAAPANTSPATKSVQPAQTAPEPAASGVASPTAADEAAVKASSTAVADAAVPFPGAPALKASTPSLNHAHPKHKYIALTLDDGYGFQPEMLDLLEQYDARCTTFLIGSWAASNKPILKRLHKDGFEIANHTWDHKALTKLSSPQMESEFARTQKVISSVTGNQAPYMRPPGGATNSTVKAVAASKGYRVVMWSRSFGDSGRGATPKKLYDNAVVSGGGVKPGDIILCHWGSKVSYQALKKVLPDLKAQGYEFVTISELIADSKASK
jgi:peptidoglycan/xylan/chitin deacetylase (PgdA/CDA1 family)